VGQKDEEEEQVKEVKEGPEKQGEPEKKHEPCDIMHQGECLI